MAVALYTVIVVAFVVVGVVLVRRTQRGAIVVRLPLDGDEQVLLEEEALKLFHRFRRTAARGGWTVTHRARSVLTDRRILLATGGPETGYAAYRRKFGLGNGYPTYGCSAGDVHVEEHDGESRLRFVIPFREAGEGWGDPPEVWFATPQAARYEDAIR
jgi:hypothetical protein